MKILDSNSSYLTFQWLGTFTLMYTFSDFNNKLTQGSGIGELMHDLGAGLEQARRMNLEISMLGGGNPAHIPAMEKIFQDRWKFLSAQKETLNRTLGDYSSPQGFLEFRERLANYLSKHLSYPLKASNLAITQGSQSAFFMLLNSFAGSIAKEGKFQKILLPLVPEYIGYTDQGIQEGIFKSLLPIVRTTSKNRFVYEIDFAKLEACLKKESIGAICLSRPTNPSGNLIPSEHMNRLLSISRKFNVPLIVDNAYGYPFPNITFDHSKLDWEPGMIQVLSLSKLGLPGLRTGIIVAEEEIATRISEMSSILNLAPGNVGSLFVEDWLENDLISEFSNDIIKPFYFQKSQFALQQIDKHLGSKIDYSIHESLGALFLWLYFPNHRYTSRQIYEKLKARGVFVISGENFFPGLEEDFSHRKQCIRLTYSRNNEEVIRGIKILAEELNL